MSFLNIKWFKFWSVSQYLSSLFIKYFFTLTWITSWTLEYFLLLSLNMLNYCFLTSWWDKIPPRFLFKLLSLQHKQGRFCSHEVNPSAAPVSLRCLITRQTSPFALRGARFCSPGPVVKVTRLGPGRQTAPRPPHAGRCSWPWVFPGCCPRPGEQAADLIFQHAAARTSGEGYLLRRLGSPALSLLQGEKKKERHFWFARVMIHSAHSSEPEVIRAVLDRLAHALRYQK